MVLTQTQELMILEYHKAQKQVLTEGIGTNLIKDLIQAGLSSGAVVLSGGAGGDTLVDIFFATKEVKSLMDVVKNITTTAKHAQNFVKRVLEYTFDGNLNGLYKFVMESIVDLAKNMAVGNAIIDVMHKIREECIDLINKVVRAVSKWVGTMIPDDFGLGGPAFEGMLHGTLTKATNNCFTLATGATMALPKRARELLLDREELEDFLIDGCDQIVTFMNELLAAFEEDTGERGFVKSQIASFKLQGEIMATPFTSLYNMATDSNTFDTLGKDYIDNARTLPKAFTVVQRAAIKKGIPFMENIRDNWCDEAAYGLNWCIKLLYGLLALIQLANTPKFMQKLKRPDGIIGLFDDDDFDLNLSDEEIHDELAGTWKENIQKYELTDLLFERKLV